MEECNRVKSEAAKAGALQSNRVVVMAAKAADDLHKDAMTQATAILLDFIERMERPPTDIVDWARPHLENLSNSLLGVVPPNNFPQDHQRLTHQYRAVFQQRVNGVLRDVEIGYIKGQGFAGMAKMGSKTEEWISSAAALALLKPSMGVKSAAIAICSRAYAGLVRARAESFVRGGERFDNTELPLEFWWAEGHAALKQNWNTGDFETYLQQTFRLQAFGVSFLRADIERMIPADTSYPAPPAAASEESKVGSGRPSGEQKALRVFLCHASGDKALVRNLYKSLKQDGFEPWLDEEDLVPGQDWEAEIRKTVRSSGVVLVCLSSRAVNKEGFVQKEIKIALDCADEKPPGTNFLIPAKLEKCPVPDRLSHLHWVDLTEATGCNKLLVALRMRAGPNANAPNAFSRSGSENQTNQLQFTFGHETKVANGLYKTDHTFSVGVKNASQSQFLSNCKVYIDIPDEGGVTPKSYLIVDTFTLNATEERLVPIVRFDEPATVSGHKGSTIQLLIPVVGGYYNVGHGWPWRLPVGAYA